MKHSLKITIWVVCIVGGLLLANRANLISIPGMHNMQHKVDVPANTQTQMPSQDSQAASEPAPMFEQHLKAAQAGDAEAQYQLAMLYDLGKEVPQDYAAAAEWYKKSAQNHNDKAFYQLGLMSDLGHGIPQNHKRAASRYREAAALGNTDAKNRLKMMYAQGLSVPQKGEVVESALPTQANAAMQTNETKPVSRLPVTTSAMPMPNSLSRGNDGKSLVDEMECMLEPHLISNIGSPVEGVLSQVNVDRGDYVSKGQIVARLNSDVEKATVDWRKAQEDFGKRKVQRNEDLYKKQLISTSEKDELETQTRIAGLELKEKQEILNQRTIRSPLNGVVVERFLVPGERVAQEKILKIAQIDPLNVEVIAPVEMFGKIKMGMSADVNLTPLLNGKYKAKVVVVDKVIDAASGTFGVRLNLSNPGNKIPAGIKCRLSFSK